MKQKGDGFVTAALRYTAIASMIPAGTFAGYLIGEFLDRWLGTRYFKIVFLLLGIASGFVPLIRELVRNTESK